MGVRKSECVRERVCKREERSKWEWTEAGVEGRDIIFIFILFIIIIIIMVMIIIIYFIIIAVLFVIIITIRKHVYV